MYCSDDHAPYVNLKINLSLFTSFTFCSLHIVTLFYVHTKSKSFQDLLFFLCQVFIFINFALLDFSFIFVFIVYTTFDSQQHCCYLFSVALMNVIKKNNTTVESQTFKLIIFSATAS